MCVVIPMSTFNFKANFRIKGIFIHNYISVLYNTNTFCKTYALDSSNIIYFKISSFRLWYLEYTDATVFI